MKKKKRREAKKRQLALRFAKLSKRLHHMSNVVTYTTDKNFDSVDNRPYAEVVIYGNNGTSRRLFCLVDTGADDIQVHEDVATNDLGINLSIEATVDYVQTASGGTEKVYVMSNVKMSIEGKIIHEDIIFGKNNIPLLGRRTILTAYDIGFNTSKWLF